MSHTALTASRDLRVTLPAVLITIAGLAAFTRGGHLFCIIIIVHHPSLFSILPLIFSPRFYSISLVSPLPISSLLLVVETLFNIAGFCPELHTR